MKANETRLDKFLATNETTFVIPVYQRNYDWTLVQCKQLLHDVLETGKNERVNAHFLGSVVYVHDDIYSASGINELTIIDGQQRLTTITLIYIVLYRIAQETGNEKLAEKIYETYLVNKYAPEADNLKLKPTENNKKALVYLLNGTNEIDFKGYSRITYNFDYFKSVINLENFEIVQNGLAKLIFVDISLDRQKDNPQRIFESLNSTGLELSQADLIRNYILMGLPSGEQTRIYRNFWEPIEKNAKDETLNTSKVSEFIRDYLTLKNKEIPNKDDVYQKFKTQYPTTTLGDLEPVLAELKSLVRFYHKLINPKNETDRDIRTQLEHLHRLEINVAHPFLMKVLEDYTNNAIDKPTLLAILNLVQSFIWRRFVLELPTSALNRIFMGLYDKVETTHYLRSIQKSLLKYTGSQRFPRNDETLKALKIRDVYNIKPRNRTYFLERLENFENREPVQIEGNADITIEHIFPQNPDPQWKLDLGVDEMNVMKENYLHSIGNLSLSGNNSKLSNKSFIFKRDLENAGYRDSRLWLNKHLATLEKWDSTALEKRFELIAERFVKIWPIPNIDLKAETQTDEVNIFEAEDPTSKKLEYAVFFGNKIAVTQVGKLYTEIFKKLFDLQPETFFSSEIGSRISLTKNPYKDKLRQPVKVNDTYFMEANMDNSNKFERIKLALTILGLEDELSIKYAD